MDKERQLKKREKLEKLSAERPDDDPTKKRLDELLKAGVNVDLPEPEELTVNTTTVYDPVANGSIPETLLAYNPPSEN